ncbi:DUF1523 family protein [Mesobaculum littorinae]|uniref:DUF1523 family protein n=1 Tax=Mesobaculum littorinae TaxID=2486419 RepID=A0A438AE42_9RHOB|nr:DUF1523 family protein [Mesobaculum littorinae]RVV96970.1 DUF1523 family protein [Mesobaculum littorinae]
MKWLKWTVVVALALIVFAFLHYTLPQRDIVRIVDTEVRRVDFGENSIFWANADTGTTGGSNRDVRFINAIRPSGRPIVYRNEDTGWGWPPYFKLDSSNLQAEAGDMVSSGSDPRWVAVRHYGWRNEFMTIYPNAVGVRPVAGPDVTLIPWFNIVFLTFLAIFLLFLWGLLRRFRRRMVDPMVADGRAQWDRVDAYADERRSGLRRWLDGWRRKPPRY